MFNYTQSINPQLEHSCQLVTLYQCNDFLVLLMMDNGWWGWCWHADWSTLINQWFNSCFVFVVGLMLTLQFCANVRFGEIGHESFLNLTRTSATQKILGIRYLVKSTSVHVSNVYPNNENESDHLENFNINLRILHVYRIETY